MVYFCPCLGQEREPLPLWKTLLLAVCKFIINSVPLFLFAGPLSSLLVNRYGSRSVVILGGLMCGLSVAAASFADSIIYLYVFISIIGGTVLEYVSVYVCLYGNLCSSEFLGCWICYCPLMYFRRSTCPSSRSTLENQYDQILYGN